MNGKYAKCIVNFKQICYVHQIFFLNLPIWFLSAKYFLNVKFFQSMFYPFAIATLSVYVYVVGVAIIPTRWKFFLDSLMISELNNACCIQYHFIIIISVQF